VKHSSLRLGPYGALVVAAFSACGLDDRPLNYEYHSLDAAGSQSSAGTNDAGGNGDAGQPDPAQGGAASGSGGSATGSSGAAGSSMADAGDMNGGTGSGGNPAAGGAGTGGSPAAGGASGASAGSSGHAGATFESPCGDLNQNSVDDCTETLVQNSRFDSAASDWSPEPALTQAWDAKNATGKPGSGSLMLSNTVVEDAAGLVMIGSRQCIPVTPTTSYDFAARVMLDAGETAGQAGLNVYLYDDAECKGNLVPSGAGDTSFLGGAAGAWSVVHGTLWVPGGVHSLHVRLVTNKPFSKPSFTAFIDDVLVARR
jgi:hypothetical protein